MDRRLILSRPLPQTKEGGIDRIGTIKNHLGQGRGKMRVLGRYSLVYVLEGGGHFRDSNGFESKVEQGDLLLLFPEIGHEYGPQKGDDWSEIFVAFSGRVFDEMRAWGKLSDRAPVLHAHPISFWKNRIEALATSNADNPSFDEMWAETARLISLLADLQAISAGPKDRVHWIHAAKMELSDNMLPLPVIAKQLNLGYRTFRKRFTEETGVSPNQFRLRARIKAAAQLIFEKGLTNKELADRFGFSDEFHFSRAFKDIYGMTSRQFRQQAGLTDSV